MANSKPKRISVSSKRQITIPKEYYEALNMTDEVLCEVIDGALVIKPVKEEVDLSPYILRELIEEGYESEELVQEFTKRKSQVKSAYNHMLTEDRDGMTYSNTEDLSREIVGDEDEK